MQRPLSTKSGRGAAARSGSAAVEIERLRRVYTGRKRLRRPVRQVVALDDVSLRVAPGEIHGLLGPNGAGKTTLCKILSTVLVPTSGRARVLGLDVVADAEALRPKLGIVFGGERGLYPRLTARQNLRYWAALYHLTDEQGRRRAGALLERFGLHGHADRPVETFSRGMKQRLHLARGLIGDPSLLLLDEPTTGMDPVAAHEFRALVLELRDEGRTVLLTTHDMAEAERVCDRVTLIDRGTIVATESPRDLSGWLGEMEHIDVEGADAVLLDRLRASAGVAEVDTSTPGLTRIRTRDRQSMSAVLSELALAGVTSIRTSGQTLEEAYLEMMGDRALEV